MLNLNNPVQIDEKEYNKAAMYLAISALNKGTDFSASVSMTLKPFRKDAFGNIELAQDSDKYVIIADIDQMMASDPTLEAAVAQIIGAIQNYMNAKGI